MNDETKETRFDGSISRDRLLHHYRVMLQIRAFEETAVRAQQNAQVPGPIHPSIGQEAVASGICGNLRRDDILLSTHRGHGHTIAKGADPAVMMRELLGREGGNSNGKGGSMHIADFSVGMLGANGVVGANIVIAAGAANAIRLKGDDRIVACIFGDGAVNRGPFLEGLNWARIYDLPVLFICEDNTYSSTTVTAKVTGGPGPGARAKSLGLPVTVLDGNDVGLLEQATLDITATIRSGGGPHFMHLRTYRLAGHTAADPAVYRNQAEVEAHWRREPIARCAARLAEEGISEEELAAIRRETETAMAAIFEQALAAPPPPPERAFEDVQDIGDPRQEAF